MDAIEYQLREMIKTLQAEVAKLNKFCGIEYDDNPHDLDERIRRKCVEYGVIEGAAEDE